ncbi:unnamed protein product [Closterium sp. Naga37s-1]|nr:unnamed protein product [Closterium sp. Naga37s-1]
MGPGIWRCKAAEIGKPGAAKAVAAVREEHEKGGSGDFTALMRKVNMALRRYSKEEQKRVKATLLHLDTAVAVLQQEVMWNPYCSTLKEELGIKESQLAAYLASEQERLSLMAGFEKSAVLPPAALEAVTVLLHKNGVKDQVHNYRPITLLNSTYTLVARVLANRMRKVLHKVISEEQYGFLPGRRLSDGVSLIADVVEATKCKDEDWYLLLVDFQKAFDSVSREYLFGTMERMGFPQKFVQWCVGLHAGSMTRLLLNGWLGDPVAVRKGVRQGCPLAPYLFLCAVEPLCQEARRRKLGISNPYGDRLAYPGYADDTTLVLKGKRQIGRAVKLMDKFGVKSGLWVNNDKSALLPLGRNLRRKPDKSSVFKWVRPNEAERVLGVWISPSGDASVTWEITQVRATAELVKWQIQYLTTSGRVAVVNGYINPILAFQAQVYPPPSEIWATLVKMLHNFVTGNHSTAGKHFALWSQELMFKARGEGGLGVRDPCAELGGLAARRIALLASQPLGLRADLALAALDVLDLQELLLFNRRLLLNSRTPAGRQKAAKVLKTLSHV